MKKKSTRILWCSLIISYTLHSAECCLLFFFFCRRVHVLVPDRVLDLEAALDLDSDLIPGPALVHGRSAATPDPIHDHVPSHTLAHRGASHIPNHTPGQSLALSHDLVQDHHISPSRDHVHTLDHDHPDMIKRHLLNLRPARIRTRV